MDIPSRFPHFCKLGIKIFPKTCPNRLFFYCHNLLKLSFKYTYHLERDNTYDLTMYRVLADPLIERKHYKRQVHAFLRDFI